MKQHHRDTLRHPPIKPAFVEALESRRLLSTAVLTDAVIPNPAAQVAQLRTEFAPSAASGTLALPASYAFVHPSIATSLEDLDTIKANLNLEPWKSGYAKLANTSTAKLDWGMDGPYANVSRAGSYDANLTAWRNSMDAVYNLARM